MPMDQRADGASAPALAGNAFGNTSPATTSEGVARPEGAMQPHPIPHPGVLLTAQTFRQFAPRAKPDLIAIIADKGNEVLARFGINSRSRSLIGISRWLAMTLNWFTAISNTGPE